MGSYYFRIYELSEIQTVMDLVFTYSVIVGLFFIVWLVMVVIAYKNTYNKRN